MVLFLAGCGGESSSETVSDAPSKSEAVSATPAHISFGSPAIGPDGVIAPRYRCGGGSIWLPLRWEQAPPGTKEFVLYLGRYHYVDGEAQGQERLVVPFGILITQLDPSRRGVDGLPPEAEPVLTHHTLKSCVPSPKRGQNILLQLFALKRPLPHPGPQTGTVLDFTEAVLGSGSNPGDPRWVRELTEESLATAQIKATYPPAGG